jgi:hypothetical protein
MSCYTPRPRASSLQRLAVGGSSGPSRDPSADRFKSNLSITSCCWSAEYEHKKDDDDEEQEEREQEQEQEQEAEEAAEATARERANARRRLAIDYSTSGLFGGHRDSRRIARASASMRSAADAGRDGGSKWGRKEINR